MVWTGWLSVRAAKCLHSQHFSVFLFCEAGGGPWTMNITIHYGLPLYFLGTSGMHSLTFLYIIGTMTWIQWESPSSSFYPKHFPKSELGDIDVWLWRQIWRQTVHLHIKWTYNANHKHKKPKTHWHKMTFVVEILPLAISDCEECYPQVGRREKKLLHTPIICFWR